MTVASLVTELLRTDRDNRYSTILTSLGLAFVIAAMWSHRDWCGYLGIALWVPGILLGARFLIVRSRQRARVQQSGRTTSARSRASR